MARQRQLGLEWVTEFGEGLVNPVKLWHKEKSIFNSVGKSIEDLADSLKFLTGIMIKSESFHSF